MPPPTRLWDVFCRVIDNHGDIGVLWRLSCQLARLGHTVRLWVDDASALAWMAPQGQPGVTVLPWALSTQAQALRELPAAQVWVEGFGCEIDPVFIANYIHQSIGEACFLSEFQPVWLNLEYLSAEDWVARCHGLPSPVMSGPARGCTKRFFYPGFTPGTGGLLRDSDLLARQARFNAPTWLARWRIPHVATEQRISLFCYEPAALLPTLRAWASATAGVRLLVAHGRPQAAMRQALATLGWPEAGHGALHIHWLPPLTQDDYDHLLWACDLNFVRGEDSLVRAIWAGKPLVWHIYPQDDGAHHTKLQAWLDLSAAPEPVQDWHRLWNAPPEAPPSASFCAAVPTTNTATAPPASQATHDLRTALAALTQPAAVTWARALREQLLTQPDLVSQLLAWTNEQGQADLSRKPG